MSRSSLKSKKCHSSHNSPTHVHPVSRCTSETQLNTISVDKKRSHDTLPSEERWGSHMVGGQRTGIKDKGYTSDHTHSPRVQSLRNYFENLTKEEEVEEARRQSIGSRCNSGNLRRGIIIIGSICPVAKLLFSYCSSFSWGYQKNQLY